MLNSTLTGRLSPLQKLAGLLFLAAGLMFSLAFFVWVDRNCTLPAMAPWGDHSVDASVLQQFRWPWLFFPDWGVGLQLAWNGAWFAQFAVLHSALAQPAAQTRLLSRVPEPLRRCVYVGITGLSLFFLMGFWQNTGEVVWIWPFAPSVLRWLAPLLFLGFMGIAAFIGVGLDGASFLGLRPLFQSEADLQTKQGPGTTIASLKTTGFYAHVRHPLYLLTLLAFGLTPILSLDRLWILILSSVYLAVGIPLEERRLAIQFGEAYAHYKKRVPALLPRLWARK